MVTCGVLPNHRHGNHVLMYLNTLKSGKGPRLRFLRNHCAKYNSACLMMILREERNTRNCKNYAGVLSNVFVFDLIVRYLRTFHQSDDLHKISKHSLLTLASSIFGFRTSVV